MKTIFTTVRGWVLVGVVLGSGGAWGHQHEVDVTSSNGCKFKIIPPYAKVIRGTPKWKGDCVNGYQEGAGVQLMYFSDYLLFEHGIWTQGRQIGIVISLTKNSKPNYALTNYRQPGIQGLPNSIDFLKMNLQQRKESIDKMLARSGGTQGLNGDEILQIINELTAMKNGGTPELAFEKYAASTGVRSYNSISQSTNGQDDPKVFGRSARGG